MIETNVEMITPQKAVEYLRTNTNNYRKLSMALVNKYIAEIKAGRWKLNGETIVFGEDGVLKDGQHRLAAVAKAGVPIQCVVVRGVAKDIQVFDLGQARTTTQIVSASGLEVNNTVMAAANLLLNPTATALKGDVIEYVKSHHSDLMRAYRACLMTEKASRKASACVAAYLMLRTGTMPFYEIQVFFRTFSTGVLTGLDGYEPSPVLIARKMFEERFKNKSGRLVQREQLEILILAMKDFHKKQKRTNNYQVRQPFAYEEYLSKVRRDDGIE